MDKTMAVMVSAAVLTAASVVIVITSSSSLLTSNDNINQSQESTICEYQIESAIRNDNWQEVDERCQDENYVPEGTQDSAIGAGLEDELT
jgi:hypothetical protein